MSDYIRKNLEKTFPQYINDLRIEYIISQWKTEEKFRNYSIESISKEAGFKARSSFLSAFKEKTGETPSGYKEKHFN